MDASVDTSRFSESERGGVSGPRRGAAGAILGGVHDDRLPAEDLVAGHGVGWGWNVDKEPHGRRPFRNALARYLDVLSIMPYHARFGHQGDPAWFSRQTVWLGGYLGIKGEPGERLKIWPIVQLSDWGERVPVTQVGAVIDHGTRSPATGVMVFVWGTLHPQWDKVEAMREAYRSIQQARTKDF